MEEVVSGDCPWERVNLDRKKKTSTVDVGDE